MDKSSSSSTLPPPLEHHPTLKRRLDTGGAHDPSASRSSDTAHSMHADEALHRSPKRQREVDFTVSHRVTNAVVDAKDNRDLVFPVRFLVQFREVGSIIGKKGAVIQDIREKSQAHIEISHPGVGTTERVVTVRGTVDQLIGAFFLMASKVADSKRPGSESGETSMVLLVPNSQVGVIIGKAGQEINRTRELSGCSLKMSEEMLQHSTEKTLTFRGTVDASTKAFTRVVLQLAETLDRTLQKPPVFYIPRPLQPVMDPAVSAAAAMYMQQFGAVPFSNSGQQFVLAPQEPYVPPEPKQSVSLPISNRVVPQFLSKRGAAIKDIQEKSGAQIKVSSRPLRGQKDRIITITGTPSQHEVAMQLIYEKMALAEPPSARGS